MIAMGILHEATWHWNVLAWALGFLVLALAVLAGALVTAALRPHEGPAVERSLFAWGPAAFAAPVFFLGLRLVQLIEPAFGPGAQHWLVGWIPGMSGAWVHPYDTLVALHGVSASLTAGVAVLFALILGPPRRRAWADPLPGRTVLAGALALAALGLPFLAFRVFVVDDDGAWLLEWLAWTPSLAVAVGLRAHARYRPPAPRAARDQAPAAPPPLPDVRRAWITAGLLAEDAAPLVRVRAQDAGPPPADRALAAWTAVGAPGLPPRALDRLLADLPGSRGLHVVGDLPTDAEEALIAAVLADLVGARGLRVLAVHPAPAALAARVRAALRAARTWEPGAIAVGADALHEAMAGQQVPALVLVDLPELGRRLVRLAAGRAAPWVRGLDLLVVHRPDLGSPVQVSHTAFAAARWHLATRRHACPPVLATCPDTPAHRAFLERLFPGRAALGVPWEARTTADTVAWPGREPLTEATVPWLARATEQVTRLGYPATALDPAGRWSTDVLPADARLVRAPSWEHPASAADLRPASLVEAAATLPHRLPAPVTHASLWLLPPEPVARFLHPARLAELTRDGRLPRPAPVVGVRNRFLRLAHLDAALREAANDERSLRAAFGDDLVDFRLRTATEPATRSAHHSAWRAHGELVRSPHLQAPPGGPADPRTDTVTDDTVDIVEERSGAVLARVDARTAPTRYYPKRVFGLGARRYRVPMHAFDVKRRKLVVELASPRDRVTRPVMSFELELRSPTVERVTRRRGRFTVHTLSADCLVTERVHAAWVPGLDQDERFDAVEARFDTEVRFVFPATAQPGLGLFHLAATVESLLPVFFRAEPDDLAVAPVRAGFLPGMGAGIAVLDRFVGGMGFAAALDDGALVEVLDWARTMLAECPCKQGCSRCTPPQALRVGPDKSAVLAMLDGLNGTS